MKKFLIVFTVALIFLTTGTGAQAQTTPELSFKWTDTATNELGFSMERGPQQAGPFAEVGTVAKDILIYKDTTVVAGTVYCYRVRAWNEKIVNSQPQKQYSNYSNVVCGSFVLPPDSTPTDLLQVAQEQVGQVIEKLGAIATKLAQATQLLEKK